MCASLPFCSPAPFPLIPLFRSEESVFHPYFTLHWPTAAQLTGFLFFLPIFSVPPSSTPVSSSSGTARVPWAGFSPLRVEEFYHHSAGCEPWVQQLSWRVFPLAGLLTGAPFLTLSSDVNAPHCTAFRCCSQLLRYPSSAIMLFIPVVSCGGHVGASFIIASNTKKSLLFFF